jgi:hypothetical protein
VGSGAEACAHPASTKASAIGNHRVQRGGLDPDLSGIARSALVEAPSLRMQQWRLGRRPSFGNMNAKLEAGLNN